MTAMPTTGAADRPTPIERDGLSRDSVVFSLGGLAGKVAGVLLLPILTRLLSPDEYGTLDVVATIGSSLTVILMLGSDAAATRFLSVAAPAVGRNIVSSQLGMLVAGGSAVAIALAAVGATLSEALFGDGSVSGALAITGFVVLGGLVNAAALNVLRIDGRALAYGIVSAAALISNAILAIVAAGPLGLGVPGVVGAWAVSVSGAGLVGLWLVRDRIVPRLDRATVVRLLRFGLPLVPATVIVWAVEVGNRTVLLTARGPADVGQLSVALRVASVAGLAASAFVLAWLPRAYRDLSSSRASAWIAGTTLQWGANVASIVVGLAWLAPEIVHLLAGRTFAESASSVGPLAAGAAAAAFVPVVSVASTAALRSRDPAIALGVGAIAGLALNLVFAPRAGALGTAVAVGLGQLIALGVAAWLARRVGPSLLDHRRMAALLAVALAAMAAAATSTHFDAAAHVVGAVLSVAIVSAVPRIGRSARRTHAAPDIDATYAGYASSGRAGRWSPAIAGNLHMAAERNAWLLDRIGPRPGVILDLGCGDAWLADLLASRGILPSSYFGLDALAPRIAAAGDLPPWATVRVGDARSLPLATASVDVAIALTLLSSMTEEADRSRLAGEVERVLRPGGHLLVYDLRWPSPGNPAVRRVTVGDLQRHFGDWTIETRSMTVLPPLARLPLLASAGAYATLARLPWLRSHLAADLVKPDR
jgi:O-antigen/teichoic acid export membrane protein/ubiquinone/menaquinone biosynthesis C-methylase UbiE